MALLLAMVLPLRAQLAVEVNMERTEYLLYEPLTLQVRVTNLSTEPLDLARLAGWSQPAQAKASVKGGRA